MGDEILSCAHARARTEVGARRGGGDEGAQRAAWADGEMQKEKNCMRASCGSRGFVAARTGPSIDGPVRSIRCLARR